SETTHTLSLHDALPISDDIEHLQAIRRRGTGVVLLDRPSPDPTISSVAVDDVRGGELAAQHLLEQGHTRITFLNGPHTIRQCARSEEHTSELQSRENIV